MHPVSKFLIGSGVVLILIGLLWQFGGKFLHFGRLPGDIVIEKKNFSFYFPLASSIILSIVFSVVVFVINLLSKK